MTIKARYRFRDYKVTSVTADQTAEPTYEAECVTGDDADCGATSGVLFTSDDVTRWMACHTRDTGHTRFRRTCSDYALVEPGDRH